MSRHVLLLRGVNVGGRRKLPMANLRRALTQGGFDDVETYLQSGNAVVSSDLPANAVARRAEELIAGLGQDGVRVLVRSAEELKGVIDGCPFASGDTSSLYVTFLAEGPDPALLAGVPEDASPSDRWSAGERVVYLDCRGGYGRTKLNNAFWERRLKAVATARNWRTVGKLLELAG